MGTRGGCARVRALLGVYVTGAIAPADRPVVLRHLASCERCRDELAGLAGLPGLLRRPSVQAAAEAPGAAADAAGRGADRLARVRRLLGGRLLGGIALRWRRHRWVLPVGVTATWLTAAGHLPLQSHRCNLSSPTGIWCW